LRKRGNPKDSPTLKNLIRSVFYSPTKDKKLASDRGRTKTRGVRVIVEIKKHEVNLKKKKMENNKGRGEFFEIVQNQTYSPGGRELDGRQGGEFFRRDKS